MSTHVIVSAYVTTEVAEAIKALATKDDRSVSKVAGRILEQQVSASPQPTAKFARRVGRKS